MLKGEKMGYNFIGIHFERREGKELKDTRIGKRKRVAGTKVRIGSGYERVMGCFGVAWGAGAHGGVLGGGGFGS